MMTSNIELKVARQPKHRLVREFVLKRMASERLKVGDALPPEGDLAESLGVGRNTVRQAMADLTRDGFIQRVPGRGGGAFVTKEVEPSREVAATGAFGLILPEVRGSFYPSLVKGFGETARRSHCALFICETGNDVVHQGDAILQMIDRRVIGVALVPTTDQTPAYQPRQLEEHGIPLVLCHRGIDDINAPLITWSKQEVARLAARAIVEHGHRRVAFVADVRYRHTQIYEDEFRLALAEYGIDLPSYYVCYNQQLANPAGGDEARRALMSILGSPGRPTAVFANDLEVGERVYVEAMQMNLRVPEDLSIISFGGKWREGLIRERLAAVVVDEVGLGREAAESLNRIRHNQPNLTTQSMISLEFVAGDSLRHISA